MDWPNHFHTRTLEMMLPFAESVTAAHDANCFMELLNGGPSASARRVIDGRPEGSAQNLHKLWTTPDRARA